MKSHFLLIAALLSIPVFGAVPKPPMQICIEDKCINTPVETDSHGKKKWHPGHYLKTQGAAHSINQTSYVQGILNVLPKVLEIPELKGAYVDFAWGAINPTEGIYNWADLDRVLNWLCSRNKVLILSIAYKSFDGGASPGLIMPADLIADRAYAKTETGMIAAIWRPSVMNRMVGLMDEIADRYDDNRCLELITTSESAPSFGKASPPSDYSVVALSTQLMRLYEAQARVFKKTNVAAQINFLGNQAATLIETAYKADVGRAGPDSFDDAGTKIFGGAQVLGAGTSVRDYRGLVLHHVVASAPALGGKDNNGPPANIVRWAQNSGITHMSWVSSVLTSPNSWSEIKSAIRASPTLSNACPTAYASCTAN